LAFSAIFPTVDWLPLLEEVLPEDALVRGLDWLRVFELDEAFEFEDRLRVPELGRFEPLEVARLADEPFLLDVARLLDEPLFFVVPDELDLGVLVWAIVRPPCVIAFPLGFEGAPITYPVSLP